MTKSLLTTLWVVCILIAGCAPEQEPQPEPQPEANMEQFGEAPTLAETTPIGDIIADPKAYVGKTVKIEGRITDVCPMKGCWIEVEDPDGTEHLKVKVEDDVIVFTPDTKGKRTIAEGKVYEINLDKEQAISYLQHLAEEKGEPFDSTSVDGPMVIYQIQGTGAMVGD